MLDHDGFTSRNAEAGATQGGLAGSERRLGEIKIVHANPSEELARIFGYFEKAGEAKFRQLGEFLAAHMERIESRLLEPDTRVERRIAELETRVETQLAELGTRLALSSNESTRILQALDSLSNPPGSRGPERSRLRLAVLPAIIFVAGAILGTLAGVTAVWSYFL